MKNKINVHSVRVFGNLNRARSAKVPLLIIAFMAVFTFSAATCSGQSGGGGKSINSPEELKKYLDSQPANSPNNPIKVSMGANAPMLPKIKDVLNSAGKYVSLNLTGNALTNIPNGAFRGCETLVGITIQNGVTSIEANAFQSCTRLTSITLPNSINSIGGAAFNDTGLTSITIPNSVTSIEGGVFALCEKLTNVTIPNSVKSIGNNAFEGCHSLASVIIGSGVTSIGYGTFQNCDSLTSVIIPNSVTSIEYSAFENCISLTSITIPNSVTSIGINAFLKCESLTSITIPNSITSIGIQAFWSVSLTSVTFQGTISSDNFGEKDRGEWKSPFFGDLREKYLAGGIGTYIVTGKDAYGKPGVWKKQ